MENIIVTPDKVLVRMDSDFLEGWVRLVEKDSKSFQMLQTYADAQIPEDVKEGLTWKDSARIPAELMQKVLGTVHHYPGRETGYVIYRNGMTGQWDVRAPEQSGSGAHVDFFEEEHPDKGFQVVGTIHTHPEMNAFWSGTDMNDQSKKPGTVHMVFGLTAGHAVRRLCTVFLGNGVMYDIPFENIVEPIDVDKDYEPVADWVKTIDAQSFKPPRHTQLGEPLSKLTFGGPLEDDFKTWDGTDALGIARPDPAVTDDIGKFDKALIDDLVENWITQARLLSKLTPLSGMLGDLMEEIMDVNDILALLKDWKELVSAGDEDPYDPIIGMLDNIPEQEARDIVNDLSDRYSQRR